MSLKVYYLDDEKDLLEIFEEIFSDAGIEISTFHDVQSAVSKIKSHPPDLLFLDYRLSNTTGDEVALTLDPDLPKVLVSGELSVDCQASFIAKIGKPFEDEKIREILSSYLKKDAA